MYYISVSRPIVISMVHLFNLCTVQKLRSLYDVKSYFGHLCPLSLSDGAKVYVVLARFRMVA